MSVWSTPYIRSSDIMDEFERGDEWGAREGGRIRNARAYRDGGLDSVADVAGRSGDLQTMGAVRQEQRTEGRFADERMQNAYQRMEQIRPLALGALNRVAQIPVEQRAAWLNAPHIRQRFEDWGITPEQYDAAVARLSDPATADASLEEFRAAFTQHHDPNWQISPYTGQAQALTPEGQFVTGGMSPDAERIQESADIELQNNRRIASGIGLGRPSSGGGGGGGSDLVGGGGGYNAQDLSAQERGAVVDARTAAQQAQTMIGLVDRFEELNRTQPTGGLGGQLDRLGVTSWMFADPERDEMIAITNRITPMLRAPGSGTMSDRDLDMYQNSLPNVGRSGSANSAIIAAIREAGKNAQGYAEFLDYFVNRNGTTVGAQELWQSYLNANPIYIAAGQVNAQRPGWRQFFGVNTQAEGAPPPQQARPDPLGIR